MRGRSTSFPSREAGPFGRRLKRERGAQIPVTVVTGFLGSGKTTLLQRFLASPEGAGHRRHRQRVRRRRHRRRAGARQRRGDRAARQRLRLLHHAHRPAGGAAPPGVRSRARRGAAVPPHRDRDLGPRRSGPDPANLLHRSRARRRISYRPGADRGRCGQRRSRARQRRRGAQAGDPRRPPRDLEDRSRRCRPRSSG